MDKEELLLNDTPATRVAVIGGARTPFAKAGTALKKYSALDLAVHSVAVGHPFAATGARIVTTLANEMKRRGARYGLVSICGAGATAGAMILERN